MADRIWTISNSISVFRILLLAPLAYCFFSTFEANRLWAVGVIILGTATDFLDGYLARRFHEVSELGKIVDPIADKIAVGTLAVFLVVLGNIPLWYVVVVLVRDVLILAGGIYIRKTKRIVAQSNWPGKVAVSAIAMYLLLSTAEVSSLEWFRTVTFWFSLFMMALSMGVYARRPLIGRGVIEKAS